MNPKLADAEAQLRRYQGFLQQDPKNIRLLEDSADLLVKMGQPAKARAYLEDALKLKTADGGLRFKLGTTYLASGDPERAYAIYGDLLSDGVDHPAVRYNQAHAAFGAGRPAETVEILDAIAESDRQQLPRYDYLRARGLYYARKNEDALRAIQSFVSVHPDDVEGQSLYAQVLEDSGDLIGASAIATKVLATNPSDVAANLVVGEVAMFMQQPEIAEPYLSKVVSISPTNGRAWSALGFVAVERRQLDSAIEHFKRAVVQMPDHLGTWHGLAWCQIMRSDLVGARQSVEAAMQLDRTFADNHGTLAVILFFQGKPDEAQNAMKRGIRLNPKSAASLFAQSLLSSAKGDKAAGQASVRKILEGRKLPDGSTLEQAIARHVLAMGSPKRQ